MANQSETKWDWVVAFKAGETYRTRSIGDHNCIFEIKVISRTKCFVKTECGKKLKVSVWDGQEEVRPNGTHSMCAIISAGSGSEDQFI